MFKLVMVVLFAAVQAAGEDPRSGSWSLVAAQSSLTPADELTIVSTKDGLEHVVMSGETHLDFTAKADGHEAAVTGNPAFNQIVLHRIGKKQVEVTEKKDGAVVATLRSRLSADGSELEITTATRGRADRTTVWTRSSGEKAGKDPLAGKWTENLSKTRLRQGLTLKIEEAGANGVHFSGDFSYTARFDGKQYDLKDSRNDSVALQLVDPHTVDATYRRDAQVTQKDRWVVSADGRQMILTTTGTLESGQHLTEKLQFKKQ